MVWLKDIGIIIFDGSVSDPSASCLASGKGMFFWNYIHFLVLYLRQCLAYAGWLPQQLAYFAPFSHTWSSCPAYPHSTHFVHICRIFFMCIILAVKTLLGIWYVHFCLMDEEAKFVVTWYFLTICGVYLLDSQICPPIPCIALWSAKHPFFLLKVCDCHLQLQWLEILVICHSLGLDVGLSSYAHVFIGSGI